MKKKILLIIAMMIVLIVIASTIFLFAGKPIAHEIITNPSLVASFDVKDARQRGYEIIERNNTYYLVICYGESTVYYSALEVTNVKVKGKVAIVDVKLSEKEGIAEAFSYPKAAVRFDKKPIVVRVNFK